MTRTIYQAFEYNYQAKIDHFLCNKLLKLIKAADYRGSRSSPFHNYVEDNQRLCLRRLILAPIFFQTGHTALQRAAAEGHVEIIKTLLENGVSVDHQDEVVSLDHVLEVDLIVFSPYRLDSSSRFPRQKRSS